MKNTLTLLVFFAVLNCGKAFAQNYLDSTSTWYEVQGGAYLYFDYTNYNKYYVGGDSVISGNVYHKIYLDGIDSTFDLWHGDTTVSYIINQYQGGLREDLLKRFYMCYPNHSSDTLLFDFNLSVGSAVPNSISMSGCNNPPDTVTAIDTVYLGAQPLKHFHLLASAFGKTLYEGICGSGGLIWDGSMCQFFETGACLIAYKKGSDSLYINCGLGANGIPEITNRSMSVFPNPALPGSKITFTYPVSNGFREIILNDINGKEIARYSLPQRSSTQHVKLPVMHRGVYVARLMGSGVEGNVKFVVE